MSGATIFRRCIGLAFLALAPGFVNAAGLGKINVLSALGQPLQAEIDLVSVTAEEQASLAAKLASPDAYRDANLEFPGGQPGFKFQVAKRPDGQPFLRVTTAQPVNEPFVDMLVELSWASGRLLREYPVLLDPPGYAQKQQQPAAAAPVTPPSVTAQPAAPKPAVAPPASKPVAPAPSAAASAPAGAAPAAGTYGPIKRGETLAKIAENVKAPEVTLEQTLVGLYRENKDAFNGKNMNRLKTGQILKVPQPTELAQIEPESAKKEVQIQTANWNAYRRKLAEVATKGKGTEAEGGQSGGGKIGASATEQGEAPADSSKDVLKLSKGQAAAGKPGAGTAGKPSSQEQLNSMQEEIASRDKALEDARSRIADLERNIKDMQRLLELKATPVPAPREGVKPAPAPAKPVEPEKPAVQAKPPAPTVEPKPAEPAKPPIAETPPAEVPPVAEAPKPVPPKPRHAPLPVPPPEPSLLDNLLANPLYPIGGLAVLGLAVLFGYNAYRRRRERDLGAFTATGAIPGGFKPLPAHAAASGAAGAAASNSSFLSDFDKIGPGNIDTDEVDPVAEADVYIAYGRDAQAEEILKEAMAKDTSRYEIPLKLLEIYANRQSAQSFETVAKQLHASIGTAHPLWAKVADMGRKLDERNPLYEPVPVTMPPSAPPSTESTVVRAAAVAAGGAAAGAAAQEVPHGMRETLTLKEPSMADSPLDLDLSFEPEQATTSETHYDLTGEHAHPAGAESLAVDLDLGELDSSPAGKMEPIDLPFEQVGAKDPFVIDFDLDASAPTHGPATGATAEPAARHAANDLALDFDLGEETSKAPESPHHNLSATDLSHTDSGMDFDLDSLSAPQPPKHAPQAGEVSAASAVDLPALDLSSIDLDLGGSDTREIALVTADQPDAGNWQSAATKLDLARAYLEIGDKVGALEILQEVSKEGTAEQQQEAKKLAAQA